MTRYVKLDTEHTGHAAALAACQTAFVAAYPRNLLSVIASPDGTLCWVKTTTAADLTIGGAVLDIQDGSNSRAGADVAVWSPPLDMPA